MRLAVILSQLLLFSANTLSLEIQANGLFKNAAVVTIDGKQRMLKAGKPSPEGVLLIEANTKRAIIEINGQRQELTLSRRISGNFTQASQPEVAIPRNRSNQYISNASINGRRAKVLVDTGASIVALSSDQAQRLGIDYKKGQLSAVITASGKAKAYRLTLRSVEVGGIRVNAVDASVVEGSYPRHILLGMTYLNHVNIREQDGILFLQQKY
ncbi:hypothetical protein BST96_09970 [Oceanicoccus sagamiensis]|uniref:Aspartyl protease n=2 Tax=Oceanicoccus sagamiensis TaxID=716816 RepID=A0A1X9NFZ2_9GAMM|nr:hypothetical protein BST96_09970 [Oceanicoccus sagamiensis]